MQIKGAWGATVALFVVVAVGRSVFGGSGEDDAAALTEQYPTKDSCLSFAAERQAQCTSPGCEQLVFQRMTQCLNEAEGDKELFCANVTGRWEDSAGRDIFAAHCEPHTPYQTECEKLIGYVSGYYCSRLI